MSTHYLTQMLRDEIAANGPISMERFMDIALYQPEFGYYRRRDRTPFGVEGDFFTASQMQPVFGRFVAAYLEELRREFDGPFAVVEMGAGRGELAEALSAFRYRAIEAGEGSLPADLSGVVFSNEFFDALPVRLFTLTGDRYCEQLIDWHEEKFRFVSGLPASGECLSYLERYAANRRVVEVNLRALASMRDIANKLQRGYVITIDYGYTLAESVRFSEGTLLSYHRHVASEQVLEQAGERDITTHVLFTALEGEGRDLGLESIRFETLAQALLRIGERDQFGNILGPEAARTQRETLQLKTLLFGMGETYRVLLQRKVEQK